LRHSLLLIPEYTSSTTFPQNVGRHLPEDKQMAPRSGVPWKLITPNYTDQPYKYLVHRTVEFLQC